MDYKIIIGIIGAVLVLIAFLMNQTNKWKNDSIKYDLVNFLGSLALVIYAVLTESYPFLVLNSVWAIFSLKDIIRKS